MAKNSGNTRKSTPTQNINRMEVGAYNNIQSMINSISKSDNEGFADSLEYKMNDPFISPSEVEALGSIALYVRDNYLDNIDTYTQKVLQDVVKQSPNVYETLYRGISFSEKEGYKFLQKIKEKKNLTLGDFTPKNRKVVSMTDKKDSFWVTSKHSDTNMSISINGGIRGLDLSKGGENEILTSSSTKVSIQKISFNEKTKRYDIRLKVKK